MVKVQQGTNVDKFTYYKAPWQELLGAWKIPKENPTHHTVNLSFSPDERMLTLAATDDRCPRFNLCLDEKMIGKSFHHRLDSQEHPHSGYCHPPNSKCDLSNMQFL